MPAKALKVDAAVKSVDAGELGKWVLAKARGILAKARGVLAKVRGVLAKASGYRKTNDREALCASKVHGDRVNNCYRVVLRIIYIRQMTNNNNSGYPFFRITSSNVS